MTHPADIISAGPSVTNAGGHDTQPNASQDTVSSKVPVIDAVREFFQYSPPVLHKHVNHITSDSTRKPAYFDKHLASDLQLRRVVYLPSMVDDLAKIAEDALHSADLAGVLPPVTILFPQASLRKALFLETDQAAIVCEEQIEKIYAGTMAKHCCVVASTLEFGLPTWNPGHLNFSLQSGTTQAKADGFLILDDTTITDTSILPLSETDSILAQTFSRLSVWEFKSLVAGELPVMEAVFDQTRKQKFRWEGCEFGKGCSAQHKTSTGLPRQTGSPMGFDAKDPLCKLPSTHPHCTRAKHKKNIKATHITQQTWAEAVINDATFVVINAGNYEFIGIRHRKQQTLYLSDLINVSSPGYGQLHTGLYIASIRDARDRALQLNDTIPDTWTRDFSASATAGLDPVDVMGQVNARDWLVVNPTNKARYLLPFIPNSHYLRNLPIRNIVNPTPLDLALLFRINVTRQVNPSIVIGNVEVDGVILKRGPKGRQLETVVLKCASNHDSMATLRNEYQVCLYLQEKGVKSIPKVVGYYEHANVGEEAGTFPCSILIMEDIGIVMDLEPGERLSMDLRQQFLTGLKGIHNAGYKHGKITKDHLMIRHKHLGEGVGFIGLGAAAPADPAERATEYLALADLLPESLKRKLDWDRVPIAKRSDFFLISGVESRRKIRHTGTY